MLTHFLDLHSEDSLDIQEYLCHSEVAEILLHEMISRLTKLALLCRQCPVPQKWIGSSVALAFHTDPTPRGPAAEAQLRQATKVNIFDWGRSELNTLESHTKLSDAQRRDRARFWGYYVGGIDHLAWDACRTYYHRFGCQGWSQVVFNIIDFDSATENDFLGRATVNLVPTPETTIVLKGLGGKLVLTGLGRTTASMTYSIEWHELPRSSRLHGVWRIKVVRAKNLPGMDKDLLRSTSDPFCEVVASHGGFSLRQVTCVKPRDLNPHWNETFEVPVAREGPGTLETGLEAIALGLGSSLAPLLPAAPKVDTLRKMTRSMSLFSWSSDDDTPQKAYEGWVQRLDEAAFTPSPAASPAQDKSDMASLPDSDMEDEEVLRERSPLSRSRCSPGPCICGL